MDIMDRRNYGKITRISYKEFDRAREEARDQISASLFAWVKSEADFASHVNDLPSIKKDVARRKISDTADRFDLLCWQKGFATASLKRDSIVARIRQKLNDVSDIDIRDVIVILSICNKINEIILKLESVMDGSIKLSIADCSVPI